MYLAAQRVRPASGTAGFNVALYGHGPGGPALSGTPADVLAHARRAERRKALAFSLAYPPGGNRLESELEIAGPDETAPPLLEAALEATLGSLCGARECVRQIGSLVVSFRSHVTDTPPTTLFRELQGEALRVFGAPSRPEWLSREPLEVCVDHDKDGWRFELAEASEATVSAAGGKPARVRVRDEEAHDFRRMYGPLYPHVAQWVTSLGPGQLLELGGVRFIDPRRGGQVVGEWPTRR